MTIKPCTIKAALQFNLDTHRRLPRLQGGMWAVRLEPMLGVAVVGRPTARRLPQDGTWLQVLRCAVLEGTPNGCSMLYGACARAARAMGCTNLVTYIHDDESGVSLKASGWIEDASYVSVGGEWSCDARPRAKTVEPGPKKRFFAPWSDYLSKNLSRDTLSLTLPAKT